MTSTPERDVLPDRLGRREGDVLILPPGGVATVVDEAHRLRALVQETQARVRELDESDVRLRAENERLRAEVERYRNAEMSAEFPDAPDPETGPASDEQEASDAA